MSKPIVLHIGEPIKYNHDFYEHEFCKRFQVVRCEAQDRKSFIEDLRVHK